VNTSDVIECINCNTERKITQGRTGKEISAGQTQYMTVNESIMSERIDGGTYLQMDEPMDIETETGTVGKELFDF